jgi:hypothetical protein
MKTRKVPLPAKNKNQNEKTLTATSSSFPTLMETMQKSKSKTKSRDYFNDSVKLKNSVLKNIKTVSTTLASFNFHLDFKPMKPLRLLINTLF